MEDNKQKNEELQEAELSNAAGGMRIPNEKNIIPCSCGNTYGGTGLNCRVVKDGCGTKNEYQCPNCGKWN